MSGFSIRDAVPEDLPVLHALYRHLHADDPADPPADGRDIFACFLRCPGNAILVGEVDGRVAASCTLVIIPNLTRGGKPYGLIENVVTHADWRKRGFGKALLAEAAARAWAAGCYKLMLMTGSRDPATLAFYDGAGFEQSKTGFQMRRPA